MSPDVLVIGGGNAALCAALMAREAGASVLLLESAPRCIRDANFGIQVVGHFMRVHPLLQRRPGPCPCWTMASEPGDSRGLDDGDDPHQTAK